MYLLQGVGLVAALVQEAVSGVGGDQRASGVGVVNRADVGGRALRGGCGDRAQKMQIVESTAYTCGRATYLLYCLWSDVEIRQAKEKGCCVFMIQVQRT